MVAVFLCITFLTDSDGKFGSKSDYQNQQMYGKPGQEPRILAANDSFVGDQPDDLRAYNNNNSSTSDNIFDVHYNPANFLEFIAAQRFNFFRKVETDYINEPENETLRIFKPDYHIEPGTKPAVEQKLFQKDVSYTKYMIFCKLYHH